MDDPAAKIRAAIQALLDASGDDWTLTQHVILMGLERVTDGRIESTSWYWCPPEQAEWMTTGLIEHAMVLREECDDL